jgi:hypothetical protein
MLCASQNMSIHEGQGCSSGVGVARQLSPLPVLQKRFLEATHGVVVLPVLHELQQQQHVMLHLRDTQAPCLAFLLCCEAAWCAAAAAAGALLLLLLLQSADFWW